MLNVIAIPSLKKTMRFFLLAITILSFGLTGCLREKKAPPDSERLRSGYAGCLEAVAIAKDTIDVKVEIPAGANEVQIFRNGSLVGSMFPGNATENVFSDEVQQGQLYQYSCKAMMEDGEIKVGYNEPTAQTTPDDAPDFAGITAASIENKVHAKITWKQAKKSSADAGKVHEYRVYANLNVAIGAATPSIDFTKSPIAVVSPTKSDYTITTGLGDNLPYVFAVMACTSNNLCSGSEVYKLASTQDNGASVSPVITEVSTLSGGIKVKADWNEGMGEIKKRRVYFSTSNSTSLSSYTSLKTVNLSLDDLKNPNTRSSFTEISVVDSRILENTQYYIAVVDEDSSGNVSSITPYAKFIGDLTPPTFLGITSTTLNPSKPDTSVVISFPAAKSQGAPDFDNNGATSYVVDFTSTPYLTSGTTTTPADPCISGSRLSTSFAANPGGAAGNTQVAITIENLTPRTYYRFCVRAKDAAGNESGNLAPSSMVAVATLDKTVPAFDGIQGLTGVSLSGVYTLSAVWNKAEDNSSSIKKYILKIWSNQTSSTHPSAGLITIDLNAEGTSLYDGGSYIRNSIDYTYGQGSTVYVLVNVCDTGDQVPGGTSNCTNFSDNMAMQITPPDITPPTNFSGISTAVSNSNQSVDFTWHAPTNTPSPWTSDFFGFRIYDSVENPPSSGTYTLSLVGLCNCATPGACVSPTDLGCTLNNLNANRTYRFHIRAVDASGNETQGNIATSYRSVTVKDTLAPEFTPSLIVSWDSVDQEMDLTWTQGTDNQSVGAITYQIYRRTPGTSFTAGEVANPTETPYATVNNAGSYKDTDPSIASGGGGLYTYLICAKDGQDNRTCAQSATQYLVPDTLGPVISQITTDKSADTHNKYKKWYLQFKALDNYSAVNTLVIKIYRSFTASPETTVAEVDGNLDPNGNQLANISLNTTTNFVTISNLVGKAGNTGYVNYLIWAQDQTGNTSRSVVSYAYDGRLVLSSVASNKASQSASKRVVVQGSNFSRGSENNTGIDTKVYLGANECTNVTFYNNSVLECDTPTGVNAGPVNVSLVNPDGITSTLTNGFTFTDGSFYPDAHCDIPANQAATPFAGGAGNSSNPYIICTNAQFASIEAGGALYKNGHFILGSHLTGLTTSYVSSFGGSFDGAGYMIKDSSRTNPLFRSTTTSLVAIKNLVFMGNTLTCTESSYAHATNCYPALVAGSVKGGTFENISLINNHMATTRTEASALIGMVDHSTGVGVSIKNIAANGNTTTSGYLVHYIGTSNSWPSSQANGITVEDFSFDETHSGALGTSNGESPFYNLAFLTMRRVSGKITAPNSNTNWGISCFPNINITMQFISNVFEISDSNCEITAKKVLGGIESIGVRAGGKLKNIKIKLNTQDAPNNVIAILLLGQNSLVENIELSSFSYTGSAARKPPFIGSLNYSAVNIACGAIGTTVKNIKLDSEFVGSFIRTLSYYDTSGCNSPTGYLTFENINIKTHDETNDGAFIHTARHNTGVTFQKPNILIKNVKIQTDSNAPILGFVQSNTSNILGLSAATSFSLSLSHYVKLENVLVVPYSDSEIPSYALSSVALALGRDQLFSLHMCQADGSLGSAGSFYDNRITNLTTNAAHTSCPGYTAQSKANLQNKAAGNVFEAAGWDFTNVWKWPDSGTGYPELR